jgi:uncharacterized protein YraI
MARSRPRRALRPPLPVRVLRVAVPAAVVGVVATGAVRVLWPLAQPTYAVPAPAVSASAVAVPTQTESRISRELTRPELTVPPSSTAKAGGARVGAAAVAQSAVPKPVAVVASVKVIGVRYTTTAVNVRTQPSADAGLVTVLAAGTKVSVTSGDKSGWTSVLLSGKGRWLHSRYLSTKKPVPRTTSTSSLSSTSAGGISAAPCPSGSAVESGLTRDAIRVHRAVCHRYPQVTTFYGVRAGDGYHATGQAIDCMISNSTVGWDIARWVRANAHALGVSEVIYSQHIWTVQRSSEGWRLMADRGSPTANHYDHVHVSVYGNSGTT